jgi:hypothetical protein
MSLSFLTQSSAFARIGAGALVVTGSLWLLVSGSGCKDSASSDAGGMCSAKAGGPVSGDKDTHCIDSSGKQIKQATHESACEPPADAGQSHTDTGDAGDAGAAVDEGYPDTHYGSEGDDDDCKYHVTWTASCIEQNKNVTFNLTVTKLADNKPLTGADPDLEVLLSDTHPAPNTVQKPKETSPGVYTAGPIKFDAKGKWTVRFHLREECVDLTPESPHGHIAFYVNVP